MPRKFIVITGSIMSGLGKGMVTSSLAKLLQSRGYSVIPIKFDGYLNVDCGTMNPFRHGEVFVLDDGTEVDLDFGTYERFLNISLQGKCSITGGKLFRLIIEKERRGDYLGRDVQFVPHLTDEIKKWVKEVYDESKADVVAIEVGGTVGDLENGYFLEAIRQLSLEEQVFFIQLTYVPSVSPGEQKTKPTQHATRLLQSLGIQPHMIIAREEEKLKKEAKEKISLYCNVPIENVIDDPYVETLYELPLVFEKQGVYEIIAKYFGLRKEGDLEGWKKLVENIKSATKTSKIAIVGKYTDVKDAYLSVKEALVHAGAWLRIRPEIKWVESTNIEEEGAKKYLYDVDGVIVPGGFGRRGIEGKISAINYARTNKIPYLGLCLGMQLMVVEWARNVVGWKDANSAEFDKETKHPVIDILPEQKQIAKMGGTMRLGAYEMRIEKGTKAWEAYGQEVVYERHRHRYEVNPEFVEELRKSGLVVSGWHKDIVEMVEWSESFGIATQSHPEFKSRLEAPAPLFKLFLKEAGKK